MDHVLCAAICVFIVVADIYMRRRVAKEQYLLALDHVDLEAVRAYRIAGAEPSPRKITQKLREECK